jgi:HK97 family phage prohead protease
MPDIEQQAEESAEAEVEQTESRELPLDGIQVRDLEKREIEARIVPWNSVIQTSAGREMFARGAFSDTQAGDVVLRMSHQDPPAGRGLSIEDREDGAYMAFRVSKTQKGDEILTLASDGVTKGVSVGFETVPGGTEYRSVDGHRTAVYTRAVLREVSTTWMPAYQQAQVLAIREQEEETPVAENPAEQTTAVDLSVISNQIEAAFKARDEKSDETNEKILDRLEKMEERERSAIVVPHKADAAPKFYSWLEAVLKTRAGEPLNSRQLEERELADVLLGDQYVPDAVRPEIVAFVNPRRPFLSSTNEVAAPESGAAISIPVMTQSPEADVQSEEKTEVASAALKIENALIPGITIAGAVDISMQFIRRGPRTYFDLLRRAMFAAYAAKAEAEGVAALLNGITVGSGPATTPQDGGSIDPNDLTLGQAWENAMDVALTPPDTLWLSPAAMAAFIDAKANTTNAPLYAGITSSLNAGGQSGTVSGLRVVVVPALAGSGVDAIVGPSEQYAWAEDGTFELQADKPAILGRDIALAGTIFYMPLAPAAFTTFDLAS